MACGVTRMDSATLFQWHLDLMSTDVLGGSPIIPESNEWYVASLNFAMHQELLSVIDVEWRERDPRYCCCDNLVKMAALDGVYPRPATPAIGYATITGTAGAALPSSLSMRLGERLYKTTGTLLSKMPSSGSLTMRVRSYEVGSSTNLSTGADLSGALTSSTTGVDTAVTFNGGNFTGGQDAETCEQFRLRYLERLAYTPSLRLVNVENLILDLPGVTRVCLVEEGCLNAANTACTSSCNANIRGFYVFMDDTFENGIVPECVVDALNTEIFGDNLGYGEGLVDIGVCGQIHVCTAVKVALTVSGVSATSQDKQTALIDAYTEFFTLICASSAITHAALNATAYQIFGSSVSFTVTATSLDTEHCVINDVGDIIPSCGYVPVLSGVSFANTTGSC